VPESHRERPPVEVGQAAGRGVSWRWLVARLGARPDSEHEQALIRIAFVGLVCVYLSHLVVLEDPPSPAQRSLLLVGAAYLVISCLNFVLIALRPARSHRRRTAMMVGDFAVLSVFLHVGGAHAAPFYPIYLWVTLGNGFRYGMGYLAASVAVAVCGFTAVVLLTPYWQQEFWLGFGLLLALVCIPAYAATLIRKLTEAKALAESSSQAKSRFLASMSHELRTPLNAIIGMSDVLRETRLDREQQDMVHTIKTSGRALLALIDDVLDLSRIEANKVAISCEDLDVFVLVADLLTIFRPQAERKGIRLGVHFGPSVPWQVSGDLRHLRQILINLVANAIKFTDRGFVALHIDACPAPAAGTVRLRFSVIDTGIGIAAEDHDRVFDRFTQADDRINRAHQGSGLGLAITANLVRLLGGSISLQSARGAGSTFCVELPFVARDDGIPDVSEALPVHVLSADAATVRSVSAAAAAAGAAVEGSGPTVAALVRLLARQRSRPGRVPLVVCDPDAPPGADAALAAALDALPGQGRPALVRLAASLGDPLPPAGCVMTLSRPPTAEALGRALHAARLLTEGGAGDAAQATVAARPAGRLEILVAEDNPVNQKVTRRILEHGGHHVHVVGSGDEALEALEQSAFDVFLVDINMPGISGLEVVKLHRMAQMEGRRLPIIALTADATPETRRLAQEAGVDAFLTKPVEAKRLIDAVAGLTQPDAAARAGARPGDGRVTQISSHPRFRADACAAVNWDTIDQLRRFSDGDAFVAETLAEYLANSRLLLAGIARAQAALDTRGFRDGVHALRGTSGNVGAEAMSRLCQEMHGISRDRLDRDGPDFVGQLRLELARFEREVRRGVPGAGAPAAGSGQPLPL
jgi:two-component system sensor histidine kinase RpfC